MSDTLLLLYAVRSTLQVLLNALPAGDENYSSGDATLRRVEEKIREEEGKS